MSWLRLSDSRRTGIAAHVAIRRQPPGLAIGTLVTLLSAALALTLPAAHAEPSSNPSFDCRKAATPVEKLICSDPALGDLDRKMAEGFGRALEAAPASSRGAMVKAQLRWLQDRASGCGLDPAQRAFHVLDAPAPVDCLRNMYEQWAEFRLGPMTAGVPPGPKVPFEAKRQPFLPRLLVSHDTPLCDAFLSALRKDFLARHLDGENLYKEPPMAIGHWVAWPSEHGPQAAGTRIDVAEMALDRNGKKQLLVHVAQPFNWRNNSYSLLVSPKTATDGLADEIIAFEKLPPLEQQTASLRIVAPPDFPSLWNWGAFDGYKSPFRVLLLQGVAYLYTFADGVISGGGAPAGTATLRRIRADGSLDLRCQASVVPRAGALPPPSWLSQAGQPDTVAVPAEVVEWMKVIRGIQGTEGRWAGTLHALNSLIIRSTYTWYDALVRPWDSGGPSYRPSPVALRSFIARWGFDSLSRFRLARDFESGRRAALSSLADYYERSFGVSNGKEAASAAVDNIIAASFVVSGTYGPNQKYSDTTLEKEAAALRRQVDDFVEGRSPDAPDRNIFRSALLIGISPTAVKAFIKAGTTLGGETRLGTMGLEPMLFYALEHPDEVRALLDGGADINEGNEFGKTALMYAAHYDLVDTVTLLLGRGADVAKRTNAQNAADTSIQFDGRTALMYAAENASERVIRALIEAGSDACAMDTGNRDVWSYVQRSRRLSNDDRARVALLIARKPCAPGGLRDQAR
jgi:uncharacterized protein YecT (DUF1311 family)